MLFASIVLTVVAAAVPNTPSAREAARLLPLADGNRWVLRDVEKGSTAAISVVRAQSGLVLRGLPGARELRVRLAGRSVEAWDPASARWEPFLRLGAPVGTRYKVHLAEAPLWRSLTVTVASRSAVVRDARGKTLRNCVRLTFAAGKASPDAGLEELVFAPGVGFVRTAEQTIAGTRVRLLASLTLRS